MKWQSASPPTRYYLLASLPARAETSLADGVSVGLMPIEMPEYLDRPDIVTRATSNRLQLASFDQWAEPLSVNVTRVIAENLNVLMPDRVAILPDDPLNTDLELRVEITRFEQQPGGDCLLAAMWTVTKSDTGAVMIARQTSVREPVSGAGFDPIVAAMNKALDRLSREIAGAINQQSAS